MRAVLTGFSLLANCVLSISTLADERVGALAVITNGSDPGALGRTMGQLRLLVRQTYSNPPQHGGRVVATVLANAALASEWRSNVRTMASRILVCGPCALPDCTRLRPRS